MVLSVDQRSCRCGRGFLGDGTVPETLETLQKRSSLGAAYLAILSPIGLSESFKTISKPFQQFCNRSRGFVAYLTVLLAQNGFDKVTDDLSAEQPFDVFVFC